MGLARSTYYDAPTRAADDTALIEAMAAIWDAFEALRLASRPGGPAPTRMAGES
jgi:predicted nucleotidyltransferase